MRLHDDTAYVHLLSFHPRNNCPSLADTLSIVETDYECLAC